MRDKQADGDRGTRCGCDSQAADYAVQDVAYYSDTDTVAVTIRARCCGLMWTDEMSQREFAAWGWWEKPQ